MFCASVAVGVRASASSTCPQARLWNARLLPFYYLALYLLAAVGIAELSRLLSALVRPRRQQPMRSAGAIVTAVRGVPRRVFVHAVDAVAALPGRHVDADGVYRLRARARHVSTTDRSFIDSWADWNFTGYEGTPDHDANGTTSSGRHLRSRIPSTTGS